MTRRELLALLSAAPLFSADPLRISEPSGPYVDLRRFIQPGNDRFPGEKEAAQRKAALKSALELRRLPLAPAAKFVSPTPASYTPQGHDCASANFQNTTGDWQHWIGSLGQIRRASFYVLPDNIVRYEVASTTHNRLEYRVGSWRVLWSGDLIQDFSPIAEDLVWSAQPWFRDVTPNTATIRDQLAKGISYWRAALDPATGIDVYGSNGIAVGDIDNDGLDEIYVCQPGGLPNRLFKVTPDLTLTDITKEWGVDVLDDSSCALFLDTRNSGKQDLVLLLASGPMLFLNTGSNFALKPDAFQFASKPKGGFTGMAAADFDRDGKLDLYLCTYVYFQSEAQYTYAWPYHDARNGPPNFLFRNRLDADGSGAFIDCTTETGIDQNNNRFSFAPAWCDYDGSGWPSLYVANDFGRKNLYRNREGKFSDVAEAAGVDDIGPGMSASWFDYDNDGKPDLYVANMWTETGQRVVRDPNFKPSKEAPEAYLGHTMGNSLFHNRGDGKFDDVTHATNSNFGRWAWASGGHDLNNDGTAEILVTCGMLTNESETDLSGFFWRDLVSHSSNAPHPSEGYEAGWNAINQFLREDYSWNGREPNVLHALRNNRYWDFSGVSGLDFADDGRAFAICDFDGDGRPDILLKNRLGPQLRFMQNNCAQGESIGIRLRGTKSNRDAIGARITVGNQTKWLDAGSGFLSQHSKTLLFAANSETVSVLWPSGLKQTFNNVPSGHLVTFTEGDSTFVKQPFRARRNLPPTTVQPDNHMQLHDTWFSEPIPLPNKQSGPGLFVIREKTTEWEVFRRYLLDWRGRLDPPLALLLNKDGHAIKLYAEVPSEKEVQRDLATPGSPLPFPGAYIHRPNRDFFKFAAGYLWANDPERALIYLQTALDRNPDNARVQALAGQIHLDANRLPEAEKAFRKALELQPNLAQAANGLGLTLAKEGQLDSAREFFEKAISLRRDYSEAINNLAVLYSRQGKTEDAIAAWRYGIQVAPDDETLYLNLGRIYVQMGQFDRARSVMQSLLDRKPTSETARRALQQLERR